MTATVVEISRTNARASRDPLERHYTLDEAAALIPMASVNALRVYLCRHPELAAPRYQRIGKRRGRFRQPRRLISAGEIQRIRESLSSRL